MKDTKNVRRGQIVLNKVTKDAGIVLEVADGIAKIGYANGYIADAGNPEFNGETGVINPGNCQCFRILRETPEPFPVPDASVMGGKLIIGGTAVLAGELVFDRVLGTLPGVVILLTTLGGDRRQRVVSYSVTEDIFKEVWSVNYGDTLYVEKDKDEILIYGDCMGEQEIEKMDGSKEKATVFKSSYLITLHEDKDHDLRVRTHCFQDPIGQCEKADAENAYVFVSHSELDDNNVILERDDSILVNVVEVEDGLFSGNLSVEMIGTQLDAVTRDVEGSFLIRTDRALYYENAGHSPRRVEDEAVMAATDGYIYLVGCSIRASHFSLTLANRDLETVEVRVHDSKDARGSIAEAVFPG